MEFLVYGTIPSDVPQYLIGDEERKYKHFPICVRKGWDYRVALIIHIPIVLLFGILKMSCTILG